MEPLNPDAHPFSINQRIENLKFGKWHCIRLLEIFYFVILNGLINTGTVFMEETPPFLCRNSLRHESNWTENQIHEFSSPLGLKGEPDSCFQFDLNYTQFHGMLFEDALKGIQNQSHVKQCTDYVFYPTKGMHLTVVNQWNLVCDHEIHVSNMASIYMVGSLVGSLVSGPLSDKHGRRKVVIGMQILLCVTSVVNSFVPQFVLFMICRFFVGFLNGGCAAILYILALEYLNEGQRTVVGGCYWTFYSFGYAFLPIIAWGVRDWRYMQTICAAPLILIVFSIWTMPESPHWLLSKGRIEEAHEVLDAAFSTNNKSSTKMDRESAAEKVALSSKAVIKEKSWTTDLKSQKDSILDLRHHPLMLFRVFIVFINWFADGMVYYGISLLMTHFEGNVFINNSISGLIEIPGGLACYPLMKWSRKKPMMLALIMSGLCMMLYLVVPQHGYLWAQLLVALTGKFMITISFNLIYAVSAEIYPTSLRGSLLTFSSVVARIGAILAPYTNTLKKGKDMTTPMMIFASISITAGIITLWLPETKGKQLPENIEEAEKMK